MVECLLCGECALFVANGDYGDITDERAAAISAGVAKLPHATLGELASEFSRQQCDACRTHLAGARYHAHYTPNFEKDGQS